MNLPIGRDSAITLSALAESLSMTRREAEEAIRQARLAGEPICTGAEGVWLASSPAETLQAAQRLRHRALTQLVTARALRHTARRMQAARVEQTTLWEAA